MSISVQTSQSTQTTPGSGAARHALQEKVAQLCTAAPQPVQWRTIDDVQPLLEAAELLVHADEVDAAIAILQPKVYDPNDKTSPINKLAAWTAWRPIAHALEPVMARADAIAQPADKLAVEMVLGTAYERLFDFDSARPYLERALVMARGLADLHAECFVLSRIANILGEQGDQQQALNLYTQALTIARRSANRSGEGMLLNNIGTIYETLGQLRKAITFYEQAWKIAQRNHDSVSENWYVYSIANALVSMGDYTAALAFTERLLPQLKRINIVTLVVEMQSLRAQCLWRLGQDAEADALFRQSLMLCQKNGVQANQVGVYLSIADFAFRRGNLAEARNALNRAESEAAPLLENGSDSTELFLPALHLRAKLACADGNPERAAAFFSRMHEVARRSSTIPFEAKACIGLATIAQNAGEYSEALDQLLRAYTLMGESEHKVRKHIMVAFKDLAAAWPDFPAALATATTINPVSQTLLQAELGL